jgi:hypothetical protein
VNFLFGFCCLTPPIVVSIAVLELWQASGFPLDFDWWSYWADIVYYGLGQGYWADIVHYGLGRGGVLLVMAFSTLLPAVIHCAFGIAGVLLLHNFLWR